jgi:hypothetical protein
LAPRRVSRQVLKVGVVGHVTAPMTVAFLVPHIQLFCGCGLVACC